MESGFAAMFPIVSGPLSLEGAMEYDVAIRNVTRTAEQIAKMLKLGNEMGI